MIAAITLITIRCKVKRSIEFKKGVGLNVKKENPNEFKEENHGEGTTVDNDYVRRSTENYYEQDQSNNDYTGSNIYSNRADYYIN